MICIELPDSQLFLTQSEATNLAVDLESQLQASHEIIIADARLTAGEAEMVIRSISDAVTVDWKVEGF